MKRISKIGTFLSLLAFLGIKPAYSQAVGETLFQQWVDYRDGEISVAFIQTPVPVALSAIRARTGFQIDIPPAGERNLVNLRLTRLPLEPAVRYVISSIGFKNFALMYDEKGLPKRAVVVGAHLDDHASSMSDGRDKPISLPLTAEERVKIQKDLERWNDLKREERGRIEDRLKSLPASEEREQLVKEYGRQLLGIKN